MIYVVKIRVKGKLSDDLYGKGKGKWKIIS